MTRQQRIYAAADEIINTRDLCGDERTAMAEFEAEHGQFSADEKKEVWGRVNGTWKQAQKQAGAKPMSPGERARAYRALED